jgi:heme/copper-type cytochrome/quinol oxidase subunit 2
MSAMSDISIHGILGALCVILAIAIGVIGVVVAMIMAAVRSSSGTVTFGAAFKRVVAGPAVCAVVGLLGLAWVAQADNERIDDVGPFLLLAGVVAGIATAVVVSRRLRRAPQA